MTTRYSAHLPGGAAAAAIAALEAPPPALTPPATVKTPKAVAAAG